jgi:hypothetical protein
MGKAARFKGLTFEARKEFAIQRETRSKLEKEQAKEELRLLEYRREAQAYENMVWWQWDMTQLRYERIQRRNTKRQMGIAAIMGMAMGGLDWGSAFPYYPPFPRSIR